MQPDQSPRNNPLDFACWHEQPRFIRGLDNIPDTLRLHPPLNQFDEKELGEDWHGYVNSNGGIDPTEVEKSAGRIEDYEAAVAAGQGESDGTPKILWYRRRSGNWAKVAIPRGIWEEVLGPMLRAGSAGIVLSGPKPDLVTPNHQTGAALLRRLGLIIASGVAPERSLGPKKGYRYTLISEVVEDLPMGAPTESLVLVALHLAPAFEPFKEEVLEQRFHKSLGNLHQHMARLRERATSPESGPGTPGPVRE